MNQQQPDLYKPGTQLTVGSHQVIINKYFSHGGFAQVYTCTINPPWNNNPIACLKRVNVPDKGSLNTLRKEVDAMRKLQGIKCIVSYIDSHAARSNNGIGPGYEVFVLMEYCSRKGLIDFMNSRLVNKLTEPEILLIMQQITEAVAHMHALNPPLIHRDIKIENVLLGDDGTYKLCDFGSVSTIIEPPVNVEEFQIIQDDIMKNTTPQYRAPEMLDLYRRQPINEKSDIWALGVFLYKLCYYTTPFEQNAINNNMNGYGGDYAIINGIYSFPPSPPYSARLKNMIAKLLTVDPKLRPNVFQLLEEICKIRGVPCPTITKQSPLLYNPISNQQTNMNTGVNILPNSTNNIPITVNGITNNPITNYSTSLEYNNGLKNSLNIKTQPKRIETPPSNNELVPPKVRNSRRPLSAYGNHSINRMGSRESLDIKNFMNELSTEEVANLSTPSKNQKAPSSIDYLKSISRQNTNDNSNKHNSKKRSSITSIKNLLTGNSSKSLHVSSNNPPTRSTSLRQSSLYSNKRNSSHDSLPDNSHQKYKHINSSLSNLQEMSPEAKSPQKFVPDKVQPLKMNIKNNPDLSSPTKSISSKKPSKPLPYSTSNNSHSEGIKRNPSIQSRVKNLFRSSSPPPLKTAQGYGKYTDNSFSREPVKSAITASSELIMPKDNVPLSNTPRHAKSLGTLYNSKISTSPQKTSHAASMKGYDDTDSSYKAINAINNTNGFRNRSPALAGKRKPPPPKPKKPEYLKGSTDSKKDGNDSFLEEDFDVLEKRFEMKFPGVA